MRKIIVLSFISLDGVIQAPGRPPEDPSGGFEYGGWIVPFSDEFLGETMSRQMTSPYALLLGRKTFEIWASYWPQHPDQDLSINAATKYVASRTLKEHEWQNTIFLGDDVVEELKQLKQQDGPDIQVHGSANLIQTLLANDLVDEFWLKIFPVTLGKGKRLFQDGAIPASFTLIESQISCTGVIVASFRRAGDVQTGSF